MVNKRQGNHAQHSPERPGPELVAFSNHMLDVVVHLRALMLGYHHAHVNARGPNFASDHALFQRLYAGTDEEGAVTPLDDIDAVMEKWKGLLGPEAHLDAATVAQQMALLLARAKNLAGDTLLQWFISTEHDLQFLLRRTLELAKQATGYEIDGVENLLQGIADRRQTNIYLLQQRKEKGAAVVNGYLQAEANYWPDDPASLSRRPLF